MSGRVIPNAIAGGKGSVVLRPYKWKGLRNKRSKKSPKAIAAQELRRERARANRFRKEENWD